MSEAVRAAAIWVDADACPRVIKDILFRASTRTGVALTLVANQPLAVPSTAWIRALQVPQGLDAADHLITQACQNGDLVVTADVPLAAAVLGKGALALDPRGRRYDAQSIGERLSMRNFMDEMRGAGLVTGGPAAFGPRDSQAFANQLDRWLAQRR